MLEILKRFREVSLKDYFTAIIFPFAILASIFYKRKNKDLILVSESAKEARDNGYWLFKYIRKKYPRQHIAYVIDFSSLDYKKVKMLGECINFGSFKHWIYYLSANVIVYSQKEGKPNVPLFYILEKTGILKNKRVFLQHGIVMSNLEWLHYKNTKFRSFICSTKMEYEAVLKTFGYPDGYVKCLGLSRFDNLLSDNLKINKKQILVMPTWRNWLFRKTEAYYKFKEGNIFKNTQYYKEWNSFLNNKMLLDFLKEKDLKLIFYPHRNIQDHLLEFEKASPNIIFASWQEYDIQELLKESIFLVTDYSSILMDFSYMAKSSVYFQFDLEKFRIGQYKQGYFDYEKDGFGPVYKDADSVVKYIIKSYENNFKIEDKYLEKINNFFTLRDNKNSERIYEYIKEIMNEK